MTAYTSIPNGAVAAGGLPSGETVTALRDNPLAIAEGAASAPRIAIGAWERLTAGTSIRSRIDAEQSSTSTSYTGFHRFAFLQKGTIRVTYECRYDFSSFHRVVRMRTNGTAVVYGPIATTVAYSSHSVDVSVLPGDVVEVQSYVSGAGPSVFLRNIRFQTGGENLFPGTPGPVEGNVFT